MDANENYNPSGVEQSVYNPPPEALAAAQAKLRSMIGGDAPAPTPPPRQAPPPAWSGAARARTTSTPGAAALAAQQTPAQRELDDLMKGEAYIDGNHPDHGQVMQRVRQLLAAEATPAEREAQAEAPISTQRAQFGVDLELRTPWARENWNEADEANFYATARAQGWDAALVRDLVADYAHAAQGTMGEITDEMISSFHERFDGRLSKEERDTLVNWIRSTAS